MIWFKELYGSDIDGNRGAYRWSFELELEDKEYIREYVQENMPEYFDGDGSQTVIDIPFLNPFTDEEVCIEVDLGEWL